jgi:molybdate transport system ATP-binding protein
MSPGLQANFSRQFAGGFRVDVNDLRLPAEAGVTVLFGPSGSGKSTVLRCLAGLERPDMGTIHFGEEVWFDAGSRAFRGAGARRVGFVPQEYALFPHLDVEQNVGYGLNRLATGERASRVTKSLRWLGLEGLERKLPGELSGGQQQRVALARAVVTQPRMLLLDEPLAALDTPLRVRLRGELRKQLLEVGMPTVLVTHDRAEALAMGDRLIVMHAGKILQHGPINEVFNRPADITVAGTLGIETVQPGRIVGSAGGLATVEVGRARLSALESQGEQTNAEVYVCIRAEDVILMKMGTAQSSARNVLPGVVRGLTPEGMAVRIELDCGFPLIALLTRQACSDLDLKENDRLVALVKAPHVQLVSRYG